MPAGKGVGVGGAAEAGGKGRVLDEPMNCGGQAGGIAGINQQAIFVVTNVVAGADRAGSDYRLAHGHGLEQDYLAGGTLSGQQGDGHHGAAAH